MNTFTLTKNLFVLCLVMEFGGDSFARDYASRQFDPLPKVDIELQSEGRQFEILHDPSLVPGSSDLRNMRDLREFYARRQYPGSPPFIPHPVIGVQFDTSQNCLNCHARGGFVAEFSAYAPTAPHPERVSCRQCHVPMPEKKTAFKQNTWLTTRKPFIKRAAIAGGPPPIPHSLEDRGACLSCHAGPSAVREVRTTHPERIHCRQCHVTSGK